MPKAKPISLHQVSFHDALKALVGLDPDKVGVTSKRRKRTSTAKVEEERPFPSMKNEKGT